MRNRKQELLVRIKTIEIDKNGMGQIILNVDYQQTGELPAFASKFHDGSFRYMHLSDESEHPGDPLKGADAE